VPGSETCVALVTGSNRGIGLETVRQLIDKRYRVWLTARDSQAGNDAAERVGARFVSLDITDANSISRAVRVVEEDADRLDVLINNAGITMDGFDQEVARGTLATNLFGTIAVTDAFLRLMPNRSVVVMVSSGMGSLAPFSEDLRRRFLDEKISRTDLDLLMTEFIEAVTDESYSRKGWPGIAYSVSKAGLNAYTRILSKELSDRYIAVNSVGPGWVRTDMGGPNASRSVEEGAQGVVWTALQRGPDAPTGSFFRDRKLVPW